MSVQINLSSNAKQLLDQVALDSREMRVAVMRALNRTADGVKTDAGREIRKTYNVQLKTLQPAFSIWRATTADLIASVSATGKPLQLIGFGARQVGKGVSVAVKRGARKIIKHAFIARMPSGHLGVFMRSRYVKGKEGRRMIAKGRRMLQHKSREAIFERYTTSVPGMFGVDVVQQALRVAAGERFDKALDQNINFVVKRRG